MVDLKLTNNIASSLSLEKFRLNLHLGVTEKERSLLQPVWVSLTLEFQELPEMCFTDQLDTRYCYHHLSNEIIAFCEGKSFHLLEYLTYQLYQLVRARIDSKVAVSLTLEKETRLMGENHGPASFTLKESTLSRK